MAYIPGQQLGNYRIVRFLGKGGFAEVYLAEHTFLNKQIAMKVLHAQATGSARQDFISEGQKIARLEHPNIVRVTDFGLDGETPYLVMEYAPNGTLRQRHPYGTQVPLATIVSYVKQVADALQYAHDERLIHRDIKPENMLVARRGDILLSDFGIAVIAQSTRYQSTQEFMGTIAYMSPEQIHGKPRPASDQYSLAIVVFEWLTGEYPFKGLPVEIIAQQMSVAPPSLSQKMPALPPDVDGVINTALAKDPHQRFGSIKAFATALEEASRRESIRVLPNTAIPAVTDPYSDIPPPPPPEQILNTPVLQPPAPPIRNIGPSYRPPPPVRVQRLESVAYPARQSSSLIAWKRMLIPPLIGVSICTAMFAFVSALVVNQSSPPAGNEVIAIIIAAFGLCTPLFFGAVFGRTAGMLTGGVGSFIGLIVLFAVSNAQGTSLPLRQLFIDGGWSYYPSFALAGFISGFAPLRMRGRYNIKRSLGFSFLGILVATAFILTVASTQTSSNTGSTIVSGVVVVLLYSLIDVICLPLMLWLYHLVADPLQRRQYL